MKTGLIRGAGARAGWTWGGRAGETATWESFQGDSGSDRLQDAQKMRDARMQTHCLSHGQHPPLAGVGHAPPAPVPNQRRAASGRGTRPLLQCLFPAASRTRSPSAPAQSASPAFSSYCQRLPRPTWRLYVCPAAQLLRTGSFLGVGLALLGDRASGKPRLLSRREVPDAR